MKRERACLLSTLYFVLCTVYCVLVMSGRTYFLCTEVPIYPDSSLLPGTGRGQEPRGGGHGHPAHAVGGQGGGGRGGRDVEQSWFARPGIVSGNSVVVILLPTLPGPVSGAGLSPDTWWTPW